MPRVGEISHARNAMWNGSAWVPRNTELLGDLLQVDSGMWATSVGGAPPQNSGQYLAQLGLMQNSYARQASATTDSDDDLPDADNPVLLLLGN